MTETATELADAPGPLRPVTAAPDTAGPATTAPDQAAPDQTAPDQTADILSQALGEAMRDQRLRQERLRHVQEFLSSPAFVDLRDSAITVSDDTAALHAHRRDLTYRISVLESMLALLTEERGLLDRVLAPAPADAAESDSAPDSLAPDSGTTESQA